MKTHLFIIVSCLFFITGCFREYFIHWDSNHRDPVIQSHSGVLLSGTLVILPNKEELHHLVQRIQSAEERIWIETYLWTEKTTQEAVIEAKKRGVDVKVILEGNVYGTPRINDAVIARMKQENIPTKFANDDFTFTHMKLWIIDNTWCVSTGNWAYTSFTKNREFIFCSEDVPMLLSLEEIFLADNEDIAPIFLSGGLDSRIGLAPVNLRLYLTQHILQSQKEIILYNQSISDPLILELLRKKQESGVQVEACQANSAHTGGDAFLGEILKSSGPYLHAKVILIDNEILLLGSANLTENAIDRNREIMIKIEKNQSVYYNIKNLYNKDCKKQL